MKKINLFSIISISLFVGFLTQTLTNTPKCEDYNIILNFLINWEEATMPLEKLKFLFKSSQEHFFPIVNFCSLLSLKILGSINFIFLAILGNTFLLGFILILKSQISKKLDILLYSLFLTPFLYESSSWGLLGIQHYGTLFFFILSLIFSFKKSNISILFSLLFGVLASFCFGNGVFSFLVLAIIHFIKNDKFKTFLFSFLFFILFILIAYQSDEISAKYFPYYDPIGLIHYTLNLYGSFLPTRSFEINAIIGSFVLLSIIYFFILKRKIIFEYPILMGLFLFVQISMLLIIISRSHISPYHALVPNYNFLSTINLFLLSITAIKCFNIKNYQIRVLSIFIFLFYLFQHCSNQKRKIRKLFH